MKALQALTTNVTIPLHLQPVKIPAIIHVHEDATSRNRRPLPVQSVHFLFRASTSCTERPLPVQGSIPEGRTAASVLHQRSS